MKVNAPHNVNFSGYRMFTHTDTFNGATCCTEVKQTNADHTCTWVEHDCNVVSIELAEVTSCLWGRNVCYCRSSRLQVAIQTAVHSSVFEGSQSAHNGHLNHAITLIHVTIMYTHNRIDYVP